MPTEPAPVRLDPLTSADDRLTQVAARARAAAGDATAGLEFARTLGDAAPLPGNGSTRGLLELLATLGAADLTVARAIEPHLDALAILAQARASGGPAPDPDGTWGVYAAELPPGAGAPRLEATRDASGAGHDDEGWTLTGTKPWCSLADRVSRALVTAWVGDGRRLFAIDLGSEGVEHEPAERWAARGLVDVPSGSLHLTGVPAQPVGGMGWYLERSGFAWGGIGVAAVWFGGAVGVARTLRAARGRRELDQLALHHLGAVDIALHTARLALADAAAAIDAGRLEGPSAWPAALRVRRVVSHCVDEVLAHTDRALGPGPLAGDEEHARRVADLRLYARQDHAERDDVAVGRALLEAHDSGEGEW